MNKLGGAVLLAVAITACSATNQPSGTQGSGGAAGHGGSGSGGHAGTTSSTSSSGSAGCDPASCASGCCAQGACVDGTANNQCGKGGQTCLDCGAVALVCMNQACEAPQAQCTPQTCPTGCCKNDACELGLSDQACGTGGQLCKNCSQQSQACVNGLCGQ